MQEWTIKNQLELNTFKKFLQAKKESDLSGLKISLTDKKGSLDRFWILDGLSKEGLLKSLDKLEITLNYAVCNHYDRNPEKLCQKFLNFYKKSKQYQNITEILLISGSSFRKMDSIFLLSQLLKQDFKIQTRPNLAVAYNPFLLDQKTEKEKLKQKISTGLISQIYLQLGDDLIKLIQVLAFLKKEYPKQKITVSILEPSKQKLASLRFRPWKGVFYSQEFLTDLNLAKQKTLQLKKICHNFNVKILWS